jgi:hypothetical protein
MKCSGISMNSWQRPARLHQHVWDLVTASSTSLLTRLHLLHFLTSLWAVVVIGSV